VTGEEGCASASVPGTHKGLAGKELRALGGVSEGGGAPLMGFGSRGLTAMG